MTYDLLKSMVAEDARFIAATNNRLAYASAHGGNRARALHTLAEWCERHYPVRACVHDTCVKLELLATRAAQPACVLVSINIGQGSSPSADYVRRGACAIIQVFSAGADDAGLDGAGTSLAHRLEAEGRVLFH